MDLHLVIFQYFLLYVYVKLIKLRRIYAHIRRAGAAAYSGFESGNVSENYSKTEERERKFVHIPYARQ